MTPSPSPPVSRRAAAKRSRSKPKEKAAAKSKPDGNGKVKRKRKRNGIGGDHGDALKGDTDNAVEVVTARRSKSESRSKERNQRMPTPPKLERGRVRNGVEGTAKGKRGKKGRNGVDGQNGQSGNGNAESMDHESGRKRKHNKAQRAGTRSVCQRIDDALAQYYANCGRQDYYDRRRERGKFMDFVTLKAIDEDTVRSELDDTANPDDCIFLELDSEFPLRPRVTNGQRNAAIFNVIQQCFKFGAYSADRNRSKSKGKRVENGKMSKLNAAKIAKVDWSTVYGENGNHCMLVANGCSYLSRMIEAVIKYSALNLRSKSDRKHFVRVMAKYGDFHRDFVHIMDSHNEADIEYIQIYKQRHYAKIRACNEHNCLLLARARGDTLPFHHHGVQQNGKAVESKEVMFYRDLMDAVHCYLVHGIDVGLRVHAVDRTLNGKRRRNGMRNGHRLQKVEDVKAMMQRLEASQGDTYKFVTKINCPERVLFLFATPQCETRRH